MTGLHLNSHRQKEIDELIQLRQEIPKQIENIKLVLAQFDNIFKPIKKKKPRQLWKLVPVYNQFQFFWKLIYKHQEVAYIWKHEDQYTGQIVYEYQGVRRNLPKYCHRIDGELDRMEREVKQLIRDIIGLETVKEELILTGNRQILKQHAIILYPFLLPEMYLETGGLDLVKIEKWLLEDKTWTWMN